MCYQLMRSAVCRARKSLVWLWHLPTKGQKWILLALFLVALGLANRSERLRRDQVLRETAKQVFELEQQLQSEIDDAQRMRDYLQDHVEDIERRLKTLEQQH
jgi:uncharacterized protein YlxW (UPF0749 family)